MAWRRVHIERKSRDVGAHVSAVWDAIVAGDRAEVTAADVAAASGVPLDVAEPALVRLAHDRRGRIRVTEDGQLLFGFDAPDLVEPTGGLRRALLRLAVALWSPLEGVRGPLASVVAAAILPIIAFCAAWHALALVFALPEGVVQIVVGGPIGFVALLVLCLTTIVIIVFEILPLLGLSMFLLSAAMIIAPLIDGEPAGLLWSIPLGAIVFAIARSLSGGAVEWFVGFWKEGKRGKGPLVAMKLVVRFVLGPPGWLAALRAGEADPLEDERRLTRLIRHREGVVAASDLVILFGWTAAEAHGELTRVLVDYGGDVVVTDQGVVLYVFPEMMRSAAADVGGDEPAPRPAWERLKEPPRLFGLSRWQATGLWLMFGLPLLGLIAHPGLVVFPTAASYPTSGLGDLPPWLMQNMGGYLYVAVLALPLLRLPVWALARAQHRAGSQTLRLTEAMDRGDTLDGAAVPVPLLVAYDGEITEDGRAAFPKAVAERAAADRLRRELSLPDQPLGAVVFDSDAVL